MRVIEFVINKSEKAAMSRTKLENAESRLLAAGLSLFARYGSERVNSNTIARRARLGIGTFYSHFADKHALLREIELRTLAGLRQARVAAIREASADPADPADRVRRAVEAAVHFAEQHPEAYRVTFGRERVGVAKHGPVISESSRPTAEALRALQRVGRLPAELDPDLAARAYLSMEVGTLLWWLEDPSRAGRAGLVDTLARLHPALR
jgi:AcrR family transcriptional regulator